MYPSVKEVQEILLFVQCVDHTRFLPLNSFHACSATADFFSSPFLHTSWCSLIPSFFECLLLFLPPCHLACFCNNLYKGERVLDEWGTIYNTSRILRRTWMFSGTGAACNALTFLSVGWMPLAEMYMSEVFNLLQHERTLVTSQSNTSFSSRVNASSRFFKCSSFIFPVISMSSRYTETLGIPCKMTVSFWASSSSGIWL